VSVVDLRAYVAANMPAVFSASDPTVSGSGVEDGLQQIPVNDATRPSADEVQRVRHALDLRQARIERERKESERRHRERMGFGFTPDGDAA
jgi:hypothetical protein